MYGIISSASYFIRQFLLPNPFEDINNGFLWNWIAGTIIGAIAFVITRVLDLDTSGKRCLSYLIHYVILTGVLWVTHKLFWALGLFLIICYFAANIYAVNRRC